MIALGFRPLCSTVFLLTSVVSSSAETIDHALFDQVLKGNVRSEQVDYLAIRKSHWKTLNAYIGQIAKADISKMARDEQLATYINAYNATVIAKVIERFHADYTVAEGKFKLFDEAFVVVGGRRFSLNHLENKIIRPTYKEPRIHVALVCAAESCPPLIARAYRAKDLSVVLEQKMKQFVNDTSRNVIDVRNGRMQLSQLFNWYAEDFGGKGGVPRYVDRYHAADTSRFGTKFLDYSWELNLAKPNKGHWIRIAANKVQVPNANDGTLERGEVYEVLESKGESVKIDRPLLGDKTWIPASSTATYVKGS